MSVIASHPFARNQTSRNHTMREGHDSVNFRRLETRVRNSTNRRLQVQRKVALAGARLTAIARLSDAHDAHIAHRVRNTIRYSPLRNSDNEFDIDQDGLTPSTFVR